jgi:hypothetical protein
MRHPVNLAGPLVAASLLAAAGCDRLAGDTWEHETLWAEGKDRVELDKRYEASMHETTLVYRVRVRRSGQEIIAETDSTRIARLAPAAARLADGRIAWRADGVVCVTTDGQPVCADLNGLACPQDTPATTCHSAVKDTVACADVLSPPEPRLAAALAWVAGDQAVAPDLRTAALAGLARGGDVPRELADALAKALGPRSETTRLWIDGAVARADGDAARIDALRRALANEGRCESIAVARSCVPELAAEVAAARRRLMARRPQIAADLAGAEQECAALPRPARPH